MQHKKMKRVLFLTQLTDRLFQIYLGSVQQKTMNGYKSKKKQHNCTNQKPHCRAVKAIEKHESNRERKLRKLRRLRQGLGTITNKGEWMSFCQVQTLEAHRDMSFVNEVQFGDSVIKDSIMGQLMILFFFWEIISQNEPKVFFMY